MLGYGGVERFWTIRYLGSPGMRTVEPQIVKGGRCVLGTNKTRGHATEVEAVVDLSASSSPFHATEKDEESNT